MSLNSSADGETFNLTVTSVTGATSDNIPGGLPQTTATRNTISQILTNFTDNSADSGVPVTDLQMATVATTATGGGVSLTSTRVSVGGTVVAADVADIKVFWGVTEVGSVTSPGSLTDIDITLTGAGSGTDDLVYKMSLNSSADGETYNLTVTSVTGATSDNISLPQTTTTRNTISQILTSFTDNSADSGVPVTDLQMATVATTATGGGISLTSTRVSVGGTVAAADVADIKVFWGVTEVGSVTSPNPLNNIDISLSGAGSGTDDLVYKISLNSSADGETYNLTVTSVTGATSDNISLPQTTATRNATAPTQTLESFTDNSADNSVPVTDLQMATVASTATGGGVALTSTRVSVGGTVVAADVADIKVFWGGSQAGIASSPGSLTDIDITLTGAGLGTDNLVYKISLNSSAEGETFNLTVTSVTGATSDNIPGGLPQTTATRNALAAADETAPGMVLDLAVGTADTITGDTDAPDAVIDVSLVNSHTRGFLLSWTVPFDDDTGNKGSASSYDLRFTEAVDYPDTFSFPWGTNDLQAAKEPTPGSPHESMQLTWTAPGDDGNSGTATSYDVRYSNSGVITEANWSSATTVTGEPTPSVAGSTVEYL
jgi:uncharacterized Zn finger protein